MKINLDFKKIGTAISVIGIVVDIVGGFIKDKNEDDRIRELVDEAVEKRLGKGE